MNLPIWRLHLITRESGRTRRGDRPVAVVVAPSELEARELVVDALNGECTEYLDSTETKCKLIGFATPDTTKGVVVVDHDYDYDDVTYAWLGDK